ncbi:MAG: hypothetical protein M1561_07885 [Gammaproteobacteria bacterium]|nr:hypothetical protein [Gammaproteobacteria bacterium]
MTTVSDAKLAKEQASPSATPIRLKFDPLPRGSLTYPEDFYSTYFPVHDQTDFADPDIDNKNCVVKDGGEEVEFCMQHGFYDRLVINDTCAVNLTSDYLKSFLAKSVIKKCDALFPKHEDPNKNSYDTFSLSDLFDGPAVCRHRSLATALMLRYLILDNRLPLGSVYFYRGPVIEPDDSNHTAISIGAKTVWHKVCLYLTQLGSERCCFVLDPGYHEVFYLKPNTRNLLDDDACRAIRSYGSVAFLKRLFKYLGVYDTTIQPNVFDPTEINSDPASVVLEKKDEERLEKRYWIIYDTYDQKKYAECYDMCRKHLEINPFNIGVYDILARCIYNLYIISDEEEISDKQIRISEAVRLFGRSLINHLDIDGVGWITAINPIANYVRCLFKANKIDEAIEFLISFCKKYKWSHHYVVGKNLSQADVKEISDKVFILNAYTFAFRIIFGRDGDIVDGCKIMINQPQICDILCKRILAEGYSYDDLMKIVEQLFINEDRSRSANKEGFLVELQKFKGKLYAKKPKATPLTPLFFWSDSSFIQGYASELKKQPAVAEPPAVAPRVH